MEIKTVSLRESAENSTLKDSLRIRDAWKLLNNSRGIAGIGTNSSFALETLFPALMECARTRSLLKLSLKTNHHSLCVLKAPFHTSTAIVMQPTWPEISSPTRNLS